MRKVLLLAAAVMLAGIVAAQPRVQLGARAGITSRDMQFGSLDSESQLGWHIAAVSRLRLSAVGSGVLGMGLFFQPEIVYSQNRYKAQSDIIQINKHSGPTRASGENRVSTIRMQTVDIPLLLSLKVSIVRAQAGPVFSVMNRYETVKGDMEMIPTRPMVGYAMGLSVDIFGGLVLDGRYHGEFKQLQNSISEGGPAYESIKGSLSSWAVGISYLF